jgi:clan AA aspartic protease (TIGR02281 family)
MTLPTSFPRRHFPGLGALVVLLTLFGPISAPLLAAEDGLGAQLEALASAKGFEIGGLDRVGDGAAAEAGNGEGDLATRIGALLAEYNYVLIHDGTGGIAQVRISGPRVTREAAVQRHAVPAERRGAHRQVEAKLTGPRGASRTVALMVDTGAATLVLPVSMIASLGFRPDELRDSTAQTANGEVPVKLGRLATAQVGTALEREVSVSFIADDKIGDLALLGMSFLNHYHMTIDAESDQIILIAR